MRRIASALTVIGLAIAGCDRNIEPFDPEEEPVQPDLSRIFPEGAERAPGDGGGGAMPAGRAPGVQPRGTAAASASIEGTVRLAAGLEGSVPDGAILFIIARHGAGGPPLAVKRVASPRFPLDFNIGPDDRMIEAMPFAGPLTVTARVDADGDAGSRNPGDLRGAASGTVDPGATGVDVLIDEVL